MAHSVGAQKSKFPRKWQRAILNTYDIEITIAAGASSGTATLPKPVNPNTSVLFWFGHRCADTTLNPSEDFPRITLTDRSTVTAVTNSANAGNARIVCARVVEFNPRFVKSVQYIQGAMTAINFVNVTITAVDLSSAIMIHLGQTTNDTGSPGRHYCRWSLTSATNAQVSRASATNNCTAEAVVVEFWPHVVRSVQFTQPSAAAGASNGQAALTGLNPNFVQGGNGNYHFFNAGWSPVTVIVSDTRNFPRAGVLDETELNCYRVNPDASSGSTMHIYIVDFEPGYIRRTVDNAVTAIAASTSSGTANMNDRPSQCTLLSWLGCTTDGADAGSSSAFGTMKWQDGKDPTLNFERGGSLTPYLQYSYYATVFI